MTDVKMTDEEYMGLALKLAQKGEGRVNPNPLVGAPGQAFFLKQPRITVLGDDILLESEVSACLQA